VILVGTSGWQYASWRTRFYPAATPQRLWLESYAERFTTVEVNSAFYQLPQRSTFESWRERTPPDFVMALKMSRYLTHIKRLHDPADPVARFLERVGGLGDKLGPVLLQLPPTLDADVAALDVTLTHLAARVQVVVEPRHPSWWTRAVRDVLSEHGAALCWADRQGTAVAPVWRTAGFGYLRLHEGDARSAAPRYTRRTLDTWLARIADSYPPSAPMYVYFNNDADAAAVVDAAAFVERAEHRGLATAHGPTVHDQGREEGRNREEERGGDVVTGGRSASPRTTRQP
jgi:uncharacterized protein YecE (DUF72 family)